jgi:cytochrome c peroxidase
MAGEASLSHDVSWKMSFSGAQGDDTTFSPLPERSTEELSEKQRLGRSLFFDKRLSHDNSISCASCHAPLKGGTDGRRFSIGIGGRQGDANAPTVLNATLNFRQFWNGRALTLEAQVEGPVTHPKEMGSTWIELLEKLGRDSAITRRFADVYGSLPSRDAVIDAIAAFEHVLVTPGAPFDRYLKGDHEALTLSQSRGFANFKSYGCSACHQGSNLGGNMFQKLGIVGDYFQDRKGTFASDDGRFQVTGKESDRHVFRVPGLRNVALTAPYFHDGSAESLEVAVKTMAKYQLGRHLSEVDARDIADFLRSLTGRIPEFFREEPAL